MLNCKDLAFSKIESRSLLSDILECSVPDSHFLLELDIENQSYVTIKNELVHKLVASELRVNDLQERMKILNQVAEYLMSSVENK